MARRVRAQAHVVGRREPDPEPVAEPGPGPEEVDEKLRQAFEALVGRLQGLADEQVSKRQTIEDRWLEDLRQYHGRYDAATESDLKAKKRSRLFANITRSKTHAWEARLADMLFPTDDRNWGIKATPVPTLTEAARQAVEQAEAKTAAANAALESGQGDHAALAQEADAAAQEAARADGILAEARRRAEAMEKEIDDQLVECQYNIQCRRAIHDAVKLGTGIIKGPVVGQRTRRAWSYDGQNRAYVLEEASDPRPKYEHVNIWGYFPDMSATAHDQCEFEFERHILNKKQLRKLAKKPGFAADSIRQLLEEGPSNDQPVYISHVRAIVGAGQEALDERYVVWEYHGALEAEDIRAIAASMGDAAGLKEADIDPLQETRVILWFCQGKVLKVGPHPLETGDSLYSVYPFEADDACIFGRGEAAILRDTQSGLNGAWRMMMDNGGVSAGPQVVIDTQTVKPYDGNYNIYPFKVWKLEKPIPPGSTAFATFDIPSRQIELNNIINLALKFADDESDMPLIAQGQQDSHITQTAQGMAMLMNSSNIVFRNAVKNFDDNMTTPNIRRAYDWNMQFNAKREIKGDFEVEARGSSVLLVREIQAQNLIVMALQFADHPIFGPMTKQAELYRAVYKSHMLAANEYVKTDDEIADEARKAAQSPQVDPEQLKLQAQKEIAEIETEAKIAIAEMTRDTQMMVLAEKLNIDLDKLRAQLADRREERDHRERIFAGEVAATDRRDRNSAPIPASSGGGYM